MRQRCENPRACDFQNYGGRGIRVCERWRTSYQAFLSDMGRRPSPAHRLERGDKAGHFEPDNCRWTIHGSKQKRATGTEVRDKPAFANGSPSKQSA
jgi:hypothetical protein